MSVSTEVQRTLVKSPPELWSELSDQDSLARHLADLGEIRITRTEPEQLVEWEAQQANGTVQIKASGWGTKVTLSVTRELPVDSASEPQRTPQPEPERELQSETTPEPLAEVEVEREEIPSSPAIATEIEQENQTGPQPSELPTTHAELEAAVQDAPEPTSPAQPRPGFFTRLFKRRKACVIPTAETAGEPTLAPDPGPVLDQRPDPEPALPFQALAAPQPIYPDPPAKPEPPADIVTELAAVEARIEQDTTELLSGVLDRLGAAHHRPFSRA